MTNEQTTPENLTAVADAFWNAFGTKTPTATPTAQPVAAPVETTSTPEPVVETTVEAAVPLADEPTTSPEPVVETPEAAQAADDEATTTDDEQKTFSPSYVTKLRNEAASYRTEKNQAQAEALKWRIALETGLTAEDVPFLNGDEKTMRGLAARLAAANTGTKTPAANEPANGFHVDGRNVTSEVPNSAEAAANAFFGLTI